MMANTSMVRVDFDGVPDGCDSVEIKSDPTSRPVNSVPRYAHPAGKTHGQCIAENSSHHRMGAMQPHDLVDRLHPTQRLQCHLGLELCRVHLSLFLSLICYLPFSGGSLSHCLNSWSHCSKTLNGKLGRKVLLDEVVGAVDVVVVLVVATLRKAVLFEKLMLLFKPKNYV